MSTCRLKSYSPSLHNYSTTDRHSYSTEQPIAGDRVGARRIARLAPGVGSNGTSIQVP